MMVRRTFITSLALTVGLLCVQPVNADTVQVVGTEFRLTRADGSIVPRSATVGTVLDMADGNNQTTQVRIDSVQDDPNDKTREITLYELSVKDAATGEWHNPCQSDPDGKRLAFPLAGSWTPTGEHVTGAGFSITCTSGVQGECVRFGYKPWKNNALKDAHQACTRMLRADYCGDGRSFTQDGTQVDIFDRLGIQKSEKLEGMSFEAAWGPQGAVCVDKVRQPDVLTLERLWSECPRLKPANESPSCESRIPELSSEALVFNHSF